MDRRTWIKTVFSAGALACLPGRQGMQPVGGILEAASVHAVGQQAAFMRMVDAAGWPLTETIPCFFESPLAGMLCLSHPATMDGIASGFAKWLEVLNEDGEWVLRVDVVTPQQEAAGAVESTMQISMLNPEINAAGTVTIMQMGFSGGA